MSDRVPIQVDVQREDAGLVLQFNDGKQRVTITLLPGYMQSVADVAVAAAACPKKTRRTIHVRASIQTKQLGKA